jgi:hypothetical protein
MPKTDLRRRWSESRGPGPAGRSSLNPALATAAGPGAIGPETTSDEKNDSELHINAGVMVRETQRPAAFGFRS